MLDLKDQIRTYYEATTEPVDVDAITVDPGAVLVGPFPDAVKRRSAMQTVTPEKSSRSRVWRGVAVAAVVLLIVVTVGVGILLATRNGGGVAPATTPPTQPTGTTQAQPDEEADPVQKITVEEALIVTDRYWAAYDTGDFVTLATLFPADAVTERFSRSEFFAWLEQYRAWGIAEGNRQTARECNAAATSVGTSISVSCTYEDLSVLHEAVGAPPVRITINMSIGADGIRSYFFSPSPFYVIGPFLLWMEEHHPGVAPSGDATVPITLSNSVEEAELFGRIRAEYAEEWAAYLDANGCSYSDPDC